jgi:diguanylate cyclase (GGDEF)-like protein
MITRMPVSARLFVYFSIGAFSLLILALFSIAALRSIDASVARERIAAEKIRFVGELADIVSDFRLHEVNYLLASDGLESATEKAELAAKAKAAGEYRAAYQPYINSEKERALVEATERAWLAYAADHAKFMDLVETNKNAVLGFYKGPLKRSYERADASMANLGAYNIQLAAAEEQKAGGITDTALRILLGVSILTACMSFVVLFLLRRQVTQPFAAITRVLSTVASGNLNIEVPGRERQDEFGTLARAVDVFIKTTRQLNQAHRDAEDANRQIEALARHDVLTGLPNRRMLAEEMDKALARMGRVGSVCAVMVIDLDRFKPVNDIYGHPTGDAVLFEIGDRFNRILRKSETLSRLGGDEFAVIAEFDSETDGPTKLAERLVQAASQPIHVESAVVEVGATIGVALAPSDGSDPESLLRAADIAMYRGKREGRGCVRFFEENMEAELRSRVQLEVELRAAIAAGEIKPHYQPIVSVTDQKLLGFEVLARWHHPQNGLLMPEVFIRVADEIGLMPELTYSLLRTACRDAKNWPEHLSLAINVSPSQLKDTGLPVHLLSILVEEGFPPERLEVEITEDALVADMDQARVILKSLQNTGIHIALDDFGTGYSSLYHLRELHFDRIKIDRSFIQSLFENEENGKIVSAIIDMGKSLGLPVTAEGVEEPEYWRKLVELGCENAQGFLFGKAMTAAEAEELIGSESGSSIQLNANSKAKRATSSISA